MVDSAAPASARRPVGRPRRDGKAHLSYEQVFDVCARLIAQHGFAGTSIRMIAAELDASTASFFHLFKTKDDLLNALIAFAAAPSLKFYDQLSAFDLPPAVALFKSIHEEARFVTSANPDYAALFYLPELRKPAFQPAQAVRTSMIVHYQRLIEAGMAKGTLRAAVPELAAEQVFQLSETSILVDMQARGLTPERQADLTAEFALRGLLVNSGGIDAIRKTAAAIDLQMDVPTRD